MTEGAIISLVVPLISAIATIITVVITNHSSTKVQEARMDAQMNDLKKDIQRIEKKLEEYNGLNIRMYEAEEHISVLDQRMKHIEDTITHTT